MCKRAPRLPCGLPSCTGIPESVRGHGWSCTPVQKCLGTGSGEAGVPSIDAGEYDTLYRKHAKAPLASLLSRQHKALAQILSTSRKDLGSKCDDLQQKRIHCSTFVSSKVQRPETWLRCSHSPPLLQTIPSCGLPQIHGGISNGVTRKKTRQQLGCFPKVENHETSLAGKGLFDRAAIQNCAAIARNRIAKFVDARQVPRALPPTAQAARLSLWPSAA